MGVMTRNTWPKDLEEGLNAHFGMAYRDNPDEWREVFDIGSSSKAFEEEVLEVGFGAAAVKGEGADFATDEGGQGWTARFTHETIALAFEITQEALEDNLYASLGAKYSKALARALKHSKEIRCAAVLNNATNAAVKGGDGVSLLSTAHPLWGGGTASNKLAVAADLSETSLEEMLIQIRKAKDDRGVPIMLKALKLVLPPELEYTGIRVTKSPGRPGTGDNDVNAIVKKGVFGTDPAVMTYLTDPDQWFIKTDAPDGLKLLQRVKVQRGSNVDPRSGNYIYTARERYSQGHSDWRGCFGSEGAG